MPTPTSPFRYAALLLAAAAVLTATPSVAAPVDACTLVDAAAINAAASAWFHTPLKLQQSTVVDARAGTCFFQTESPKHINISFFYAPRANAPMYGFNRPLGPGDIAVPNLGNAAIYNTTNDPADRYKAESLAILKGAAVLVMDITTDKSLPPVGKDNLAGFGTKLVPKM